MRKRLDYDVRDSTNVFLLVILLPIFLVTLLVSLVKVIFPSIDFQTLSYLSLVFTQLSFLLIYLIYNRVTRTNFITACKINFKLNLYQILLVIVIGIVAMYSFSPLVNYIDYLLRTVGYPVNVGEWINLSNFGMFAVTVLVVAVLPPICEELIFRGVILNGLKKFKPTTAIVLSGLMFAIMHMSIEQTIFQFVLGMVLASVVLITGSLLAAVLLHFFNNFFIVLMTYLTQNQEEILYNPSTFLEHLAPFLMAIAGSVMLYSLLKLLKKVSRSHDEENPQTAEPVKEDSQNAGNLEIQPPADNPEKINRFVQFFKNAENKRLIITFFVGIIVWVAMILAEFA